jgi:hypothetical protein
VCGDIGLYKYKVGGFFALPTFESNYVSQAIFFPNNYTPRRSSSFPTLLPMSIIQKLFTIAAVVSKF